MKSINSRFALFSSLLISLNAFVQNASALDFTWTNGGANQTWDDSSSNWTTGSGNIPWVDGNTAIFGATGAGPITVSGTRTITGLSTNAATYTFSAGGTIALSGAATPFVINNNVTINSAITGSGLTKTGAGTLTLSGAISHTGATTVNAGTLALTSVDTTLASSVVTANSTGILTVANANATGSAVTRANGLTLNGGKLKIAGSSAQDTTDTFGVLSLGQGAGVWEGGGASASVLSGGNNVIFIAPNAAKNTRLNFTSVTANAGGTILFSAATGSGAIGTTTLASVTPAGINIAFTGAAPALIGDAVSGGTITTTSGIIPWAVANTVGGTSLADFVTYDADFGVRTLTSYGSTLALAGGVAQNVKLTAQDSTNNNNATVNSLILASTTASITQTISGTLTVNSGALLLNPGFTTVALSNTIDGGTLQLGTGGVDGFISMQQARQNTINSVISGPDASHHLTIGFGNANNGGGVLVLGANNSYAGKTIVNSSNANSSLVIGGSASGTLPTPTLTPGTTGSFGSGDVALNNIKVLLNRSDALTIANNFSGGAGAILQSAASTVTLSGNISGSVGVGSNHASGTLVLSGTNTHSGATTVSAGTLQINGPASMSAGSAVTLANGATLKLRSDTTASFPTAGISAPATGTYNIDVGNLTSGTGQTLTLAGAMDFANGNQSLNVTSGSTYTLGLGAITHGTTANGSIFTINAATVPTTISSFKFGSFGSNLTLQSGNVSIGGLIFNSNGSETITVAGANATFTGSNTATGSRAAGAYAVILNSGTLNMNYAGFMSNINSGGSSLTLAGGTLDNTSGGAVTESWNPTVALNGDFAFGGTNALNLGTGAVTLNASRQITTNGSALLTLGGNVSGSGHTITKAGSGSLRLSGAIGTGSGGVAVTGGSLTLAGISTFTGGTTVGGGTLTLANGGTAGTIRGSLTINSGAIVNLTAADALGYTTGTNVETVNIAGGTLNNAINGNNGYKTNFVLTGGTMAETVTTTVTSGYNLDSGYGITTDASATSSLISGRVVIRGGTLGFTVADGAAADDLIVSGVILENGGTGISKSGVGKMVISAANTYTGNTTVNAGTLAITGTGNITNSPLVDVHAGAFFDVSGKTGTFGSGSTKSLTGAGTVVGPASIAGTIAPGAGVATLTTGAVSLTGTLAVEINGATGDKLLSTGAVTLTGASLTVSELAGGFSQPSYVIAQGTSLSGTFSTVPSGYQVNYTSTQAILTKTAPSGYAAWAALYAGNEDSDEDYNGDGVPNGVAYFMGATGGFVSNPSPVGGAVTWPRNPAAAASYVVETSSNLMNEIVPGDGGWAPATSGVVDNGTSVVYTLGNAVPKRFARIKVIVAP